MCRPKVEALSFSLSLDETEVEPTFAPNSPPLGPHSHPRPRPHPHPHVRFFCVLWTRQKWDGQSHLSFHGYEDNITPAAKATLESRVSAILEALDGGDEEDDDEDDDEGEGGGEKDRGRQTGDKPTSGRGTDSRGGNDARSRNNSPRRRGGAAGDASVGGKPSSRLGRLGVKTEMGREGRRNRGQGGVAAAVKVYQLHHFKDYPAMRYKVRGGVGRSRA